MKLQAAPVIFLVAILGLVMLIQQVRADSPPAVAPDRVQAVVAYENDEIVEPAEDVSSAFIARAQPVPQTP